MKSLVLLAMMINVLGTACGKRVETELPEAKLMNVSYGPDAKQVYDVYLPAGRSSGTTRVMFLFHGGSWSGGDKRDFNHYIDSLKKYLPEYAFVNVNYRLATYTTNKFPTQENDVKAAVDHVLGKATSYQVSDDIVLLGASAGAHLALLQAYKHDEPVKAKAVVSFFGVTDFRELYHNPAHPQIPYWVQVLLGGSPTANPSLYDASSPAHYVDAGSPATLLFQGAKDPMIGVSQARLLEKKLDGAGVANELVIYEEEGHGWMGPTLHDSFLKVRVFLAENVKD